MYFLQNVDRERKYKFLYLQAKQEAKKLKKEIAIKSKAHLAEIKKLSIKIAKIQKEKDKLTQELTEKTFSSTEKAATQKLTEKTTTQKRRRTPTRTSSKAKIKRQPILNSVVPPDTLELKETKNVDPPNT